MKEKYYREKIIEIVNSINDTKILAFIYGFLDSITS